MMNRIKALLLITLLIFAAVSGGCKSKENIQGKDTLPNGGKTHTVKFDSRDGTAIDSVKVVSGGKIDAPTVPKKTGYILDGWYTSYTDITLDTRWSFLGFTVTSDITLYANWTPIIYTVEYDKNDGTSVIPMVPQLCIYDVSQKLYPNIFTRTGYDFAGWNTKANGNGTAYIDEASFKNLTAVNEAKVTLYAQWAAKTYTVTLNKNNGAGGTDTVTATFGSSMPSGATAPTRTGYTFQGYYDTSSASGGTQYYNANMTSARTWDKATDITLYARWQFKSTDISAGDYHSLAIDTAGNLWAWGRNNYGQLGDGSTTDRYSPVQIKSDTTFKSVAAGTYHSLAIDTAGNLWAWGYNGYGQLGDGSTTNRTSPVQIKSGTMFKSVSAGKFHSLAIDTAGNLWAWGENYYGQLGE